MSGQADKFATPRVAAGLLFRDDAGRVLLRPLRGSLRIDGKPDSTAALLSDRPSASRPADARAPAAPAKRSPVEYGSRVEVGSIVRAHRSPRA